MPSCRTANPLQRGSACLSCRKRKLKCDGAKPVCRQCMKMNRKSECEYDDKRQKSRTQKLREKLLFLEERVRELEADPGTSMSNTGSSGPLLMPMHTPESSLSASSEASHVYLLPEIHPLDTSLATTRDVDSSSSTYSPFDSPSWPAIAASMPQSSSTSACAPFYSENSSGIGTFALDFPLFNVEDSDSEQSAHNYFEMSPFTGLSGSTFPYMLQWNPKDPLPYENKKILLEIFFAHRHQCWFDGDIDRFDFPPNENYIHQPHPALMNAMYLLACFFSRFPACTKLEPVFFSRALHEINVALDNSDRLVDIVRASSLLAVYLYSNCRALEGYCHSFSAARLAVGLGLHQIRPPDSLGLELSPNVTSRLYSAPVTPQLINIPAPRDRKELADRISVFWQVFMVDRCWSVANGLPVALPDGDSSLVRIKTPWPSSSIEPENGDWANVNTVSTLFDHQPLDFDAPVSSLRAKAAALYERTFRLASVTQRGDTFWDDYRSAEVAVKHFEKTLPAFGYEAWRNQPPLIDLFTIYTMVHVSVIHLHRDSLDKATFEATNSILSLIRQLSDGDYEYLDPILAACWSCVAKLYTRKLGTVGKNSNSAWYTVYAIEQVLDTLIGAMKSLSAFFPLSGDHARKIEQERVQARSCNISVSQ